MRLAVSRLAVFLLAVGCSAAPPDEGPVRLETPIEAERTADATRGRALLTRLECARCHTGEALTPVAEERSCVSCHQAIREGIFDAPAADQRRWRRNLRSLNYAPALDGRLRAAWIAVFLQAPHDVRPNLPAQMPRLPLDAEDARDLAAVLGTANGSAQEGAGDPAPGLALIEARCTGCHAYSGALDAKPAGHEEAVQLAPDLRFTRDRMTRAAVARWLDDPGPLMPAPLLTATQTAQVLDALLHAPLRPAATTTVPGRLPLLTRPVRFGEVNARVFRRTCRHCHADPDFALGDGGAGNTGGFGYRGRGVNLLDYAGVSSGYLDGRGERRSLFQRDDDGVPHLVRVLLARHAEESGEPVEGITGMPLGLPPVPIEDIQLVESWIAQGRPN